MSIFNLTQHPATAEQVAQGVYEPDAKTKQRIQALLTFDTLPDTATIAERAQALADIVRDTDMSGASDDDLNIGCGEWAITAMIGGAPYLMSALEEALRDIGVRSVYAFSVRESVEQTQPDGSVRKINVFRHVGFVRV